MLQTTCAHATLYAHALHAHATRALICVTFLYMGVYMYTGSSTRGMSCTRHSYTQKNATRFNAPYLLPSKLTCSDINNSCPAMLLLSRSSPVQKAHSQAQAHQPQHPLALVEKPKVGGTDNTGTNKYQDIDGGCGFNGDTQKRSCSWRIGCRGCRGHSFPSSVMCKTIQGMAGIDAVAITRRLRSSFCWDWM